MREFRQVIWGVLAATVSAGILLGSLSITLVEGGLYSLLNATPTYFVMLVTQPVPTILPSRSHLQTTPTLGLTQDTPLSLTKVADLVSLSPTPRCSPPAGWSIILVGLGDTLASIAEAFNTTEELLSEANCLDVDTLLPGTELYVPDVYPTDVVAECGPPAGWVFYTVKAGDTLSLLGRLFGVTVAELQFANCLGSSTLIRVGQKLYVPNVPTQTPVVFPTDTTEPQPSNTATLPPSPTIVLTLTPTPPFTATPTPSPTITSLPTQLPTETPTPTETLTPVPSPTNTPTPLPTSTATDTPLPTSTATATPVPGSPTPTPTIKTIR
jgi:LysM repeat protein